jgi:hypothetical protein
MMRKINLEQELNKISAKNKVDYETQLAIDEANRILDGNANEEINALKSLGMANSIAIKQKVDQDLKVVIEYEQLYGCKVYRRGEIKKLAQDYILRFLPSEYYQGNIDPLLPRRIVEFEKLANINRNEGKNKPHYMTVQEAFFGMGNRTKKHQYYILAPKSSFELQEKPKDPLLFYRISDDKYCLVHKWGDDLSVTRRVMSVLSTTLFVKSISFSLSALFTCLTYSRMVNGKHPILSIIMAIAAIACSYLVWNYEDEKDNWDTNFK